MAKELVTNDSLLVYVVHGVKPFEIVEIEQRFNINMDKITRNVYGMLVVGQVRNDVIELVQVKPTQATKEYYYADWNSGCRIFAEQAETGVHLFMTCEKRGSYVQDFIDMISV